jgi:hypothetical protein
MIFSVSISAIANVGKYERMTATLISNQNITQWQHYSSAAPFCAMNGRRFALTCEQYFKVISNSFLECEDLDAYANRKGVTDACKAYIFKGMKEWVALSSDQTVSQQAWVMGTQYAFNTDNPFPTHNVFDFNGWAAGIRVAKSKGY